MAEMTAVPHHDDIASSSTASCSASTSYVHYDIFISHCGRDKDAGIFATALYSRLLSRGLHVFLDKLEFMSEEEVTSQIKAAISLASVQIVIFSPNYAQWKWCLDALIHMTNSEGTTLPVFYKVKPSEVRWTGKDNDGPYALWMRDHEEKERYDLETIRNWRDVLFRVSNISGFELEACNGDEAIFLEEVVASVLRKVGVRETVARYQVGLDEKVKDFENKVFLENHESAKPQVVGIVGVGGVGKTTLAKKLFDRKRVDYSKFCFLSNVRENAKKGFLNSLQRQLLKSLTGTDVLINSIDEGIAALKKHLSSDRVFVILDDVDHLNQINALFPVRTDLLSDSLVLITSRDEKVIRSSGVENASIYQLTGLNYQHSRELLCAYAFNQSNPVEGFESLVDNFLEACEGLPSFLEVFGALLFGKDDKSDWKELLDKLQQVLPDETQEKLQISYQSLDMEEQQMFLDTACFFIGQKRDTAIRIWEGSGWKGRLGFQTLQDRCLLEVDTENNIDMRGQLRDFGRAVADASLPRRLLHSTTKKDMLKQFSVTNVPNEQVTTVRGIRVVLGEYYDDVYASGGMDTLFDALDGIDMRTLKLLDTENAILERILRKPMHIPSLIWLRWNKCPNLSLPSWIPMKRLRVLQVSGRVLKTLWEDEQVPLQLRELEIKAPLSNIPKSIGQLKHLERIVVGGSGRVNLIELPEEFCDLKSLKALVLKKCSRLKSLPNSFGKLTTLEHIDLSFCCNLERLPNSFSSLRNVQHIDLSQCHDLERLPDSFGSLRNLQTIDLRGCHDLKRLPNSFGNLKKLQHINLSGCYGLKGLPNSFGDLRNLQDINLSRCHNLESLPYSFGNLTYLQHINLSNCDYLETLPDSFDNLRNLQHIDLSRCHNLESLPNSLRKLKQSKILCLEGCSYLI